MDFALLTLTIFSRLIVLPVRRLFLHFLLTRFYERWCIDLSTPSPCTFRNDFKRFLKGQLL